MVVNYTKALPRDSGNQTMQEYPAPIKALAINGSTNQAASSVITLTQDTTAIEIATAGAGHAVMRWIATADTAGSVVGVTSVGATFAANFDHVIPANTARRFVVPRESGNVNQASVQGMNRQEGLYRRVAFISQGASSIITTEY